MERKPSHFAASARRLVEEGFGHADGLSHRLDHVAYAGRGSHRVGKLGEVDGIQRFRHHLVLDGLLLTHHRQA